MPLKRPTIISVIGILNIVFGALGVFTSLCCGIPVLFMDKLFALFPQPPGQPSPGIFFAEMNKVPGYFALQCSSIFMSFFTGCLLIVSGIGFLRMKRWGRFTGIGYSIIGILWATMGVIVQQMMSPEIMEATKRAQAQTGQNNPLVGNTIFAALMSAFGLIVAFGYPIVELVLMMLPAVKNGLAGKTDPAWEPDPDTLDDKPAANDMVEP